MNKLFIVLITIFILYAQEETNPIGVMFAKMGIESLMADFEKEKNITQNNTKGIEKLEKNIELLVKFMELTKKELQNTNSDTFTPPLTDFVIIDKNELKQEIVNLVKQLSITKQQATNKFIAIKEGVRVRSAPNLNAKILKVLNIGDIVEFTYCNEFNWCQLKDGGFSAKYLFKKINQ